MLVYDCGTFPWDVMRVQVDWRPLTEEVEAVVQR